MVKRKHTDPRVAVMGLFGVAAIITAVLCFYLAIKWGRGDITCSFGKFPGVTGQLYMDHETIKALPKLMESTKKFVDDLKNEILGSKDSRNAMIKRLNGRRGPMGQQFMMIATLTTDDQVKGDMLTDVWQENRRSCRNSSIESSNPFCTANMLPKKGRNIINYMAPDGTYEVREWVDMAMRSGSAWSGAWWRNHVGVVVPKLYYIQNVPGADLMIVSWFWIGETFDDVYVGFTEDETVMIEKGRVETTREIKDGEFGQGGGIIHQ